MNDKILYKETLRLYVDNNNDNVFGGTPMTEEQIEFVKAKASYDNLDDSSIVHLILQKFIDRLKVDRVIDDNGDRTYAVKLEEK